MSDLIKQSEPQNGVLKDHEISGIVILSLPRASTASTFNYLTPDLRQLV